MYRGIYFPPHRGATLKGENLLLGEADIEMVVIR